MDSLDDSLFEDSKEGPDDLMLDTPPTASQANNVVPGLHFHPELCISSQIAASLLQSIEEANYFSNGTNQVMLFGRATISSTGIASTGLPPFIDVLLRQIQPLLRAQLPSHAYSLLFPNEGGTLRSRQAIFNRYSPGEGITSHVDLLQRYGDGILGISLGSGCTMDFQPVEPSSEKALYLWLPENSVIVLEGDARYKWTHGIRPLHGDAVEDKQNGGNRWIPRGVRTSITLRWLLPGADIVGTDG